MQRNLTRRGFLRDAALAALATSAWTSAPAQTLSTRLDWATFKKGRDYASFMDAVRKMRANTNAADKRSWAYWSNVHVNFCPHNVPYFLAWHRGYLHLFERQLRAVSGNPALTLPYWDYYRDPAIPVEFTAAGAWNPLYVDRVNTNVLQALSMTPFSSTMTHFQRDTNESFTNAISFEPALESQPHNPVHDLIGGLMNTMQSPLDPIFWLHHANVDRLTNAWLAAGDGRSMPAATDPYWDGVFNYAAQLTLPKASTADSRTNLRYFYENEVLPTGLPTPSLAGSTQLAAGPQATEGTRLLGRPPYGSFGSTPRRATGPKRMALGGVSNIPLGKASVSARLSLDKAATQLLDALLKSFQHSPFAPGAAQQYNSIKVVMKDVKLTDAGARGGYFYKLYVNLPDVLTGRDGGDSYLFGNLGPFRLNAAMHHDHPGMGARVEFDITALVRALGLADLSRHSFSFERISGENSPDGDVMTIGECRLELA